MDAQRRRREIEKHYSEIRRLEAESAAGSGSAQESWPPSGVYWLWHLVVGMVLGGIGAGASLLANVVAAPLFGHRPLELIRVFLTFPMGERALTVEEGTMLGTGCFLYLGTGALFGIAIHLVITLMFADAPKGKKFWVATVLGLLLWIVNFYLILSWLQPALLGGNWILSMMPWWVGALTHLAFAWTVVFVGEIWARFESPVVA